MVLHRRSLFHPLRHFRGTRLGFSPERLPRATCQSRAVAAVDQVVAVGQAGEVLEFAGGLYGHQSSDVQVTTTLCATLLDICRFHGLNLYTLLPPVYALALYSHIFLISLSPPPSPSPHPLPPSSLALSAS